MTNNGREEGRERGTLVLKRPFGRTFWLALALFAVAVFAAEAFSRSPFAARHLPSPSLGINHQNLDLKFAQLFEMRRRGTLPECILIGPSTVDAALDPDLFATAMAGRTGRGTTCYNFGVGGLTLPPATDVTAIITDLFAPELIVQGIHPADFDVKVERPSEERIAGSAWLRYRLGEFSTEGWLIDRSWSYRYFLRARQWMEWPDFSAVVSRKERGSIRGFANRWGAPPFEVNEKREARIRKKLAGFRVYPERLDLLGKIVGLRGPRGVVFAEMPLHPRLVKLFPGAERDRRAAMEQAAERIAAEGSLFVGIEGDELYGETLWQDYNHLNSRGAELFSRELGRQVGEALAENGGRAAASPGT